MSKMSTEDPRKMSETLERVGHMIEQCMFSYMSKKQIIESLYKLQNIEPVITMSVWERLENKNKDFFKTYNLRLVLRDQITQFNNLLSKQLSLFDQMNQHGIVSNGHHLPTMNHNAPCNYVPENVKPESMQHAFPAVLPGGVNGCVPSEMQSGTLNMVVAQKLNDGLIRNEPGCFGDSNLVNHDQKISFAPVSSFENMNSVPHGPLVDDSSLLDIWKNCDFLDLIPEFDFSRDP